MKQDLIRVFEDTKRYCAENEFLREAIKKSIANTRFYAENDYPSFEKKAVSPNVTVTKFKTIDSASYFKRKYPNKNICILNFASATNPGGGVEVGSTAQEEAICRTTTLYPVLNTETNMKNFYNMHRARKNAIYTDSILYTPGICIIKSDTDMPSRLKPDKFQQINVITCAAPNLRIHPNNKFNPGNDKVAHLSDAEIYNLHIKRANHILAVAAANNNDIIILGAFGCGAFQNPPDVVAKAYHNVIMNFPFEEINFAVYCSPHDKRNFEIFKKEFS